LRDMNKPIHTKTTLKLSSRLWAIFKLILKVFLNFLLTRS